MSGKERDRVLLLSTFQAYGKEKYKWGRKGREGGHELFVLLTNSSSFIVSLLYVCLFLFFFFLFSFSGIDFVGLLPPQLVWGRNLIRWILFLKKKSS